MDVISDRNRELINMSRNTVILLLIIEEFQSPSLDLLVVTKFL